jgi:hypothetical protein
MYSMLGLLEKEDSFSLTRLGLLQEFPMTASRCGPYFWHIGPFEDRLFGISRCPDTFRMSDYNSVEELGSPSLTVGGNEN